MEALGLNRMLVGWEALPQPEDFDDRHRTWRAALVHLAYADGKTLMDGAAAKLINTYLKLGVVCGYCDSHGRVPAEVRAQVGAIHPPVDSILLENIAAHSPRSEAAFFRRHRHWSRLGPTEYDAVIERLKEFAAAQWPGQPLELWRLEEFWEGFRTGSGGVG